MAYFDELRKRHFPPARNYLPAHLTLFHALPGERQREIESRAVTECARRPNLPARATGLRSLGRGVAFDIESAELAELRSGLVRTWHSFLTAQDRQKWRPHITIQNKVSPETACALMHQLKLEYQPLSFALQGLELWHYDDGPWQLARSFSFADYPLA